MNINDNMRRSFEVIVRKLNVTRETISKLEDKVFSPIFSNLERIINRAEGDLLMQAACSQTFWTVAYAYVNADFMKELLESFGGSESYLMIEQILLGHLASGEAAEFYDSLSSEDLAVIKKYNPYFVNKKLPDGMLDFSSISYDWIRDEVLAGVLGNCVDEAWNEVMYALIFRYVTSFETMLRPSNFNGFDRDMQFEFFTFKQFYETDPSTLETLTIYRNLMSVVSSEVWFRLSQMQSYVNDEYLFIRADEPVITYNRGTGNTGTSGLSEAASALLCGVHKSDVSNEFGNMVDKLKNVDISKLPKESADKVFSLLSQLNEVLTIK